MSKARKKHPHPRGDRFFHRRRAPGTPPGFLSFLPETFDEGSTLRLMVLEPGAEVIDRTLTNLEDLRPYLSHPRKLVWLDVDGFGSVATLRAVADLFGLHPLAMEDVVNTHQRAKVEDYETTLFFVAHKFVDVNGDLDVEQVALFLGKNFVVTFQERPGDAFEAIRARFRRTGMDRGHHGADFLLYSLLDLVVDSVFPILERMGDRIDEIEDQVVLATAPSQDLLSGVHAIRRNLHASRRLIWPLREALGTLLSVSRPDLVGDPVRVFLRDCQDHTLQILDILESYRERATNLTDLYLSSLSHRMNEVMKVLTVIATVFMPLTFIVGVYGMNFDPDVSPYSMPELRWPYGYVLIWGVMILIAGGMMGYFIRKGWLRS